MLPCPQQSLFFVSIVDDLTIGAPMEGPYSESTGWCSDKEDVYALPAGVAAEQQWSSCWTAFDLPRSAKARE